MNFNTKILCEEAQISQSGYYKWLKTSNKEDKDYQDYLLIKEIFNQGKEKYGIRVIKMRLKSDKNINMNLKKVRRIKNKYKLLTKIRRKNPYKMIMKKRKNIEPLTIY